jgi:hypothetical protein
MSRISFVDEQLCFPIYAASNLIVKHRPFSYTSRTHLSSIFSDVGFVGEKKECVEMCG